MNPQSGNSEKKIALNHMGGKAKLESPAYSEDFSLRILKLIIMEINLLKETK